ncbi:myb-like protein D [Copidosoma floridanum]|uniref:myb-like protein D n=1 Tax=Copidosoma floridanum TaxID=29053 RepID=UPI0006C99C0C|nr:myb-like protein D [Copidosoma floridanum]
MADKCKECGCTCKRCIKNERKLSDMHLHEEIENLKQCLVERDNHILTMETHFFNEAEKFPNGELASLKEEIFVWEDKYTRLHEAHKRVQKVNQSLEDKLLKIVDKCETEKSAFAKDIATLSHRLAEANYTIHQLTQDNEKYRNDVNLAIQLLQCKPLNFVGQKYESLPPEVQVKVRAYISQKGPNNNEVPNTELRSITVPISTFPPTAMVYNIAKPVTTKLDFSSDDDSKSPVDIVSAAIMAKILEEREKDRIFARHCNTCSCHRSILKVDTESQTEMSEGAITSTKDYSKKCDSNELKNPKNGSKDASKLESRDISSNKGRAQSSDVNVRYGSRESACTNSFSINGDNSRAVTNHKSEENNQINLRNTNKLRNGLPREGKASEKQKILDDQAKLDLINQRLWKNSARTSAQALPPTKESPVQLDVINERTWRYSSNNSSKTPEKPIEPARLTVIEVRSSDDLTNQSEKVQMEITTSPSLSNDSMIISSSDPSSLSSDVAVNHNNHQTAHSNNSSSDKKERPLSGPRNCLMRVTPGSKNVLLDNVGAYQTVLYTSGSRPSTALVHVPKSSSRSGRSASMSSEENDNTHLQRVAQWVDTLSHNSNSTNDTNHNNNQLPDASSMLSSSDSAQDPLLLNPRPVEPRKPNNAPISQEEVEEQRDLMSFEGFSDDEHTKFALNNDKQDNITKQIEETYMKLAADLGPAPVVRQDYTQIDMMTIEEYRREQKRLQKSSQAKFSSRT